MDRIKFENLSGFLQTTIVLSWMVIVIIILSFLLGFIEALMAGY